MSKKSAPAAAPWPEDEEHTCPNCGRCKHCGHVPQHFGPVYPVYPLNPSVVWPPVVYPYWTAYGNTTTVAPLTSTTTVVSTPITYT